MVTANELLNIVRATGEIYGKSVSDAAAVMFLADLSGYSGEQIKSALQRCRRELKTFPSIADVVARIDDGRPGVEEAWALLPQGEESSVVWTEEMQHAYSVCRHLLQDDRIAARMAFKEAYQQVVAENRSKGIPARWSASLGQDRFGREAALREAVQKSRLSLEHVEKIMPEFQLEPPKRGQLTGPGINIAGLLQSMPKEGR